MTRRQHSFTGSQQIHCREDLEFQGSGITISASGITELDMKYLDRLADNTVLAREKAEMKHTIAVQEAELRGSEMKVRLYEGTMTGGERVSSAAMINQIMALG